MFVKDDFCVDFMLVTSYLPIVSLVLRCCMACGVLEFLSALHFPHQGLLALCCALVFWDFYTHRATQLSVVCGGIGPPTIAALIMRWASMHPAPSAESAAWPALLTPNCDSTYVFVMACMADIALGVACSFHLSCVAFHPSLLIHTAPLLWTLLCVAKCCLVCSSVPFAEIVCRAILYYVSSMLVLYATPYLPSVDRAMHRVTTPQICLHFLVVHLSIAAGSMLIFGVVLSKVYFKSKTPHVSSSESSSAVPEMAPIKTITSGSGKSAQTDTALLEQLRRAKAQKTNGTPDAHI